MPINVFEKNFVSALATGGGDAESQAAFLLGGRSQEEKEDMIYNIMNSDELSNDYKFKTLRFAAKHDLLAPLVSLFDPASPLGDIGLEYAASGDFKELSGLVSDVLKLTAFDPKAKEEKQRDSTSRGKVLVNLLAKCSVKQLEKIVSKLPEEDRVSLFSSISVNLLLCENKYMKEGPNQRIYSLDADANKFVENLVKAYRKQNLEIISNPAMSDESKWEAKERSAVLLVMGSVLSKGGKVKEVRDSDVKTICEIDVKKDAKRFTIGSILDAGISVSGVDKYADLPKPIAAIARAFDQVVGAVMGMGKHSQKQIEASGAARVDAGRQH